MKLYKLLLWGICFVLLSHNSACVSIATGALEGATENQIRKNRINYASKSIGFDREELIDYKTKLTSTASCLDRVEAKSEYYLLDLKAPENPTYSDFANKTYINYQERQLLAKFVSDFESCYDRSRYARYSSPLVAEFKMIIDRMATEIFFLISRLDNGEITWGQYNRQIQKIASEGEYRMVNWESKMRTMSSQVVNMVALQEEADLISRQRQAIRNEFRRNEMQLQSMRNENRRLENERRHLESCARYPGKYMNCPPRY